MNKRCCFAGHGKIYDTSIKEKVKTEIKKLIETENVREFWVGNYGKFDAYSACAVRELKNNYPDIKLELVVPYITKNISQYKEMFYENYDSILISDVPENTPKRFYISKTNEYMINKCDYLICYVTHAWSGAATTMKYALGRKHIKVINIGENLSSHF